MTKYEELKEFNKTLKFPWNIGAHYIYSILMTKDSGHIIRGNTFEELFKDDLKVFNEIKTQMIDFDNTVKAGDLNYKMKIGKITLKFEL